MDFSKDIDKMTQHCASVLVGVKTDFTQFEMPWNPEVVAPDYGLYCICSGVLWAPSTGFIVDESVVDMRVGAYFRRHHQNVTYHR